MQPCGVGKFSSVEFICCPQSQIATTTTAKPTDIGECYIVAQANMSPYVEESVFDKASKDPEWEDDDSEFFEDDEDDGLNELSKEDAEYDSKEADEIITAEIKNEVRT